MYLNPFFNTYLAPHSNKYFVGKLVNNSRFEPNTATAQSPGSFGHTIAKVASGGGRNLLWGSIALDLAPIPNYLDRGTAHAQGVMSLPKAIRSTPNGMLGFSFVPELQALRDVASAYHASDLAENSTFDITGPLTISSNVALTLQKDDLKTNGIFSLHIFFSETPPDLAIAPCVGLRCSLTSSHWW
jgi:hypothetical protein